MAWVTQATTARICLYSLPILLAVGGWIAMTVLEPPRSPPSPPAGEPDPTPFRLIPIGPNGRPGPDFPALRCHDEDSPWPAYHALGWLLRHQDGDGAWRVAGHAFAGPAAGPPPLPGDADPTADLRATALVLMAFTGFGYDHHAPNPCRKSLLRALDFLLEHQAADGSWGDTDTDAFVTMALAELYGLTVDSALRPAAQAAVDRLRSQQTGGGWAAPGQAVGHTDTLTTCLAVLALKSARASGLDDRGGLDAAKDWLTVAWTGANPGRDPHAADPIAANPFPATMAPGGGAGGGPDRTIAATVIAVLLGWSAEDPLLVSLIQRLPSEVPMDLDPLEHWMIRMVWLSSASGGWWERIPADNQRLFSTQHRDPAEPDRAGSWSAPTAGAQGDRLGGGDLVATVLRVLAISCSQRLPPVVLRR